MAKSEEAPLTLLGDDEENAAGLEVVQAKFVGRERSSFEGLISGYSSMRALTYSNSVSIVSRTVEAMESLEVVFGREDVIGGMNVYFQFLEQLAKDLTDEVRGRDIVEQKISSGDVKLFVVKEMVNHEKLFLLEGERGKRVITGSANLSERAFSGTQNESYICFDDDEEAWEYFGRKYEEIKSKSATSISKKAVLSERFAPENLPVLSFGEEGSDAEITVAVGKPPAPNVIHKLVAPRRSKKYEGLNQVIPSRNGRISIDAQKVSKAVRYIKSHSRTEEENPEEFMSVQPETGQVVVSGRVLDLEPEPSEVERDAKLLSEYFAGYEGFRGDADKLARDYFTFMSWLYAGPFVCDLRNAALSREEHVLDYPVFGILYGKSNCGKSELVRTLLVSMFQKEGFLRNDWFTNTQAQGLMVQNKRYPLAFDDLDKNRFNRHAVALIKDDYLALDEYPVTVLSMNAEQDTFGTEIRKRALILYTNASLPDHLGESRKLASDVRRIRRDLGNALYREYLKRALTTLREEKPKDILAFSSEILSGIFAGHLEELPEWCRATSIEEYGRGKHDKFKDDLIQRMRYNPETWSRRSDKIVLRLEDIHDLRKLKRDAPDYLISSGSGGNTLVFEARELEELLGDLPFENNGLAGLLSRLFGGRR